jgi:acetyl-CoA carboxylase biotin carboxyl carrier protein
MDINKIQALIKFVSKQGVSEVQLENEEFKITIKTDKEPQGEPAQVIQTQMPMMPAAPMVAPAAAPAPAAAAPAPAAPAPAAGLQRQLKMIANTLL